jgi:hypothetical protein
MGGVAGVEVELMPFSSILLKQELSLLLNKGLQPILMLN